MYKEPAICALLLAASLATLTGCNPQQTSQQTSAPVAPAPVAVSVPGPVPGTRLTEDYVRRVGGLAYLWGWPMVNIHNRKLILAKLPEPGLMGGIVPVAPINQLSMVRDYIDPGERLVACPNQDVVYGFGLFSLDQEPLVVQVPDFGDRFWVYQVVDQRTDSFVQLGKMYGTKPGFYLLAQFRLEGNHPPWDHRRLSVEDQSWRCDPPRLYGRYRGRPSDRSAAADRHSHLST